MIVHLHSQSPHQLWGVLVARVAGHILSIRMRSLLHQQAMLNVDIQCVFEHNLLTPTTVSIEMHD